MSDLRPDGRVPHCDQDFGGSHYHCARCNGVTGMYGHFKGALVIPSVGVVQMDRHFCCPDDCEKPEAHPTTEDAR